MLEERRFGIRDSLDHEIPIQELDPRTKEITEVLSLLRENPIVVLTADPPNYGKSTFARILRHKILTQEPRDEDFPDCVYMRVEGIELGHVESKRQDRFTTRDRFSYADLRRLHGLIIFDEFYPEYLPLALTFSGSKLLLIIQPNFLQGPPFDNEEHQQLDHWVKDSQIPVYKLGKHGSGKKPTE
ncbi:hypothetical protein COT64_00125 [Candidatus Shapirobacteria bacterium CG09_land_8_20_14_0_10_39_12]|uniref:Uncharacterized protein n=1 Tax=Candidatus Shapirobacteria bacterium CG09_land_8_20_14_0_10_39_12 TaxID=1974885 RepID=A0A2H0WQI5_9BACT|nr:MAG: hypothetical protein COT64_00125 [Candidatus Shapirobacteria bacterium CG09_land_8_20_14_0_10_39_12]